MSQKNSNLLTDSDELLYRQIHPNWMNSGRPTSLAFKPSLKDNNHLSTDRSYKTTAAEAYHRYLRLNLKSQGTWGVTVGEFKEVEIDCFYDPIMDCEGTEDNPAHSYADFSSLEGNNKKKSVGKILRRKAANRGCLYSDKLD